MDDRFYDRWRKEQERAHGRRETSIVEHLTAEWFPEEREFFDDRAQLSAACCGRRAGKTRGLVRDLARDLTLVPGARLLYLNSTRDEAERIAWWGNRNDGIASLNHSLNLGLKLDQSDLTAYCAATDGWLFLRGADNEKELRKALGGAYHKVYWDEAQKIPPKLEQSIREVFMPSLLDFGGTFRMTGTPSRQMSGLFYQVTRTDKSKRLKGWKTFHWNILANPFFGKDYDMRWKRGIEGLAKLYGSEEEPAEIDSPLMQREAFGRWVHEDAAYVYEVHKVAAEKLFYARHRQRTDGFVDIPAALLDLPWNKGKDEANLEGTFFALGADLGYNPDPFALVLWAWHMHDPALYEVASWRKNRLTSDEQNHALQAVRECVNLGLVVADAGGGGKPTVKGWSREWVERYRLPIVEAEKAHKYTAQTTFNSDLRRERVKLREDGPLYEEMSQLQWSAIVSATGKMIEDPTMPNDCCDAALYGHRHSYNYRGKPEDRMPPAGSRVAYEREAQALEDDMYADDDMVH